MLGVAAQDVVKRFPGGTVALAGVDLRVEPGERVVLLGPNGSGKSTILRCMVGLEPVSSGSIRIGDVEVTTARGRLLRETRGQVGFVFQRFNLVGRLSVFHNVLHGALGRTHSIASWWPLTAPQQERDDAMTCLGRVGLDHLAGRRADTLSGEQQQRLALARTLMPQPRLILADEPVANLDPKAGREAMELLWSIGREQGLTIICALHQLDLARQYGERLVGLHQGRVVLDTSADLVGRTELEYLYEHASIRPMRPLPSPSAIGAVVSLPLALLAARNTSPNLVTYGLSRAAIAFMRAVPGLVWGLVFIVTVGLGLTAGIFAIAVDTIGFCGRFFAERVEEIEPGPLEALRSTGATEPAVIAGAILPAAMPSFVATTLFQLEGATRSAVVLGLVGAV